MHAQLKKKNKLLYLLDSEPITYRLKVYTYIIYNARREIHNINWEE